jgi:outer membrane immunogenic protein
MNTKFASLALIAALGLAAAPAYSADNGFYLGVGVTKSDVSTSGDTALEYDDEGYKAIVGFRPLDWLAFEVNYTDIGKTDDNALLDVKAKALSGFVLGLYEIKLIDLYAKVGVTQWNTSIEGIPAIDEDDDDLALAYGVGIGVHFGSVGVRAEYEQFEIDEPSGLEGLTLDTSVISIAFTYTFL